MVKHVSSKFFRKNEKKRTSNNSDFFEEGYDDRTLKKISDHRKSEKKFLEGFVRQVVFSSKKMVNLILFERTPSKKTNRKKGRNKKKDRTNKVLQREMTNSKLSDFSTKNEK